MKIKVLTQFLESIAPSSYQESYDNSGLIVGNANTEITGVLICLDSTEAVIDEAIEKGYNLVIAHHPIVFKGLKRLNGKNYIERVVIKAIKHDIAIYSIHTNLDNVYNNGVNTKIAQKLGLVNTEILAPKSLVKKLVTFVPVEASSIVRKALQKAGAGSFNNFEKRGHSSLGIRFEGQDQENAEMRLEVLFQTGLEGNIIKALFDSHPSNNPFYNISTVENRNMAVGSGMIGDIEKPTKALDFLKHIKSSMKVNVIRHTALLDKKIKRVAVCGGSGSFLLSTAIRKKADIFITADFKYHEFFDADNQIIIADIGHYESEQYTINLLEQIISDKFSKFAICSTRINTNPINYLT